MYSASPRSISVFVVFFFKKTPRFSLETVASSTTRARAPRLKRRLEQRCTVRLLLTDPARPLRARIHPTSLSGCGSVEGSRMRLDGGGGCGGPHLRSWKRFGWCRRRVPVNGDVVLYLSLSNQSSPLGAEDEDERSNGWYNFHFSSAPPSLSLSLSDAIGAMRGSKARSLVLPPGSRRR